LSHRNRNGILPENTLFRKYTATPEDAMKLLRCMRYHYADDRLRMAIESFPELISEKHKDIAALLSMHRESVTRAMNRLVKHNRITIF